MRATLALNGLINTYFGKQTKFHSNSEVQIKKTFASKTFMEPNNGLYGQQNASFSYDYTTRKMIRQLSIIFIMSPNQSIKKWNWQSKQHSFKNVNKKLLFDLIYNQWKNTNDGIHWFSNINENPNCKFMQLDMKEFHPSISEETLNKAINFAKNHISISKKNMHILKHCRESLLFYDYTRRKGVRQLVWLYNG